MNKNLTLGLAPFRRTPVLKLDPSLGVRFSPSFIPRFTLQRPVLMWAGLYLKINYLIYRGV